MATGVGSLQYPYHITRTYCSLARAPHTHPLVFVMAVSHMRAGPVVSATSWSSKLSTPRSHRHRFCIVTARFSIQPGRWIPQHNRCATRELGEICVPACM